MDFALFVYLASTIDQISTVLFVTQIIGIVAFFFIVVFILYGIAPFFDYFSCHKRYFVYFFFFNVGVTLVPTEKTMWMMAGAYASQTAIESKIGEKVVILIEKKLDEQMKTFEKTETNAQAR